MEMATKAGNSNSPGSVAFFVGCESVVQLEKQMFDFFAKGGVLVVPILLCSVLATAIFLERFIRFCLLKRQGFSISEKVADHIGRGEVEQADRAARSSGSPMGNVLAQGIEVITQEREILETVIIHAVEQETRKLSRYLEILATIANITPMLGLLGTVIGMIKAFMVIQEVGGRVNASLLAGGIWEAMLTTALGLAVALPAMVAHSYLAGEVERFESELQTGAVRFFRSLGTNGRG